VIIVCGILADGPTELMCARLADMGLEYVLLDQLRYPGEIQLTWNFNDRGVEGCLRTSNGSVDLTDVSGVYVRYVNYRGQTTQHAEAGLSDQEKKLATAEYQLSIMQLFDALPCTVINRAHASTSNDSKIYQAYLARSFGFETPRTLVTTIPDAAREFYESCDGKVIYKSLSSVRSIVHRMTVQDLGDRLDRLRNCPTQFQEVVEGIDIRVHVVGDEIFATEVISTADDYRYARREGASLDLRPIEIPPPIADACRAFTRSLGLVLSGIDLRRTGDGRYVCFEVNPSPGFIFYEANTGQPISTAIAHALVGCNTEFEGASGQIREHSTPRQSEVAV
jgi:glutathione synthase/RimK-type ligase-like ATP-grasp enzyme